MGEKEESEKARKKGGRKEGERERHIRNMSTNHTFGDKGLPDSLPAFQAPGRKLYQLLLTDCSKHGSDKKVPQPGPLLLSRHTPFPSAPPVQDASASRSPLHTHGISV